MPICWNGPGKLTPAELARESRRDIVLTHLWERPELYRGVPDPPLRHGPADPPVRVQAEQDRLALRGLDRAPPTHRQVPICLRLRGAARRASRSGPNVSERVVFNGYFLKIMKYQAGDVARGRPAARSAGLDGIRARLDRRRASPDRASPTLFVVAGVLGGIIFVINLGRFGTGSELLSRPARPVPHRRSSPQSGAIPPSRGRSMRPTTGSVGAERRRRATMSPPALGGRRWYVASG